MIFIFSYEREEMLTQVLSNLSDYEPIVIDDGSSFFIPNCIRYEHEGKQGFWKKWRDAFEMCKKSDDDFFMFMPDDFLNVDMDRILSLHEQLKDKPYVYNIINDGREWSWLPFKGVQINEHTMQIGFTDCGFFCNRKALEAIDFKIDPVDPRRWKNNPNLSSGVGQKLTKSFTLKGVKMYKPMKSLAYHGNHESKMNPEERKINPLISL